MHERTQKPCLT